ncbi:MAG: ribonuclease III [Gammaproteobacteria bacterium]|nr:ribonuclease III [Gammaproteobacteria bacterium]
MRASTDILCRALGYRFSDASLLEQALTHRSVGGANNERLEFLGDAILGFVIADELYHRFAAASEGQLSRLRSSLVKRETLADIALELALGDYLNLGPGELRSGGMARASILADGVEAILAAIYLDNGYEAARQVILEIYAPRLAEIDLKTPQKDPKTRLQELLQSRKVALPSYEIVEVSGSPHEQQFKVLCSIDELGMESAGTGSSRRRAEQAAAQTMLQGLTHG